MVFGFKVSAFFRKTGLDLACVCLIGLLSYLPPLAKLGYYWDDWYFVWLGHAEGARGIYDYLVQQRLATALLFSGSYELLGNAPLGWHLAELLLRLLSGVVFWWLLHEVWAEQRLAKLLGAALFVAYAGYWGQHYAIAHHNYLVALLLGVVSIACSLRAINTARWGFTLAALLTELGYLFTLEGFIGLEVLRLLLVGYLLARHTPSVPQLLKQVASIGVFYGLMVGVFLVWQSLFVSASRTDMNLSELAQLYRDDPIGRAQWVAYEVGRDFANPTLRAWTEAWFETSAQTPTATKTAYFLYGVLGMVVLSGVAWQDRNNVDTGWATAALRLGILATLAALLPLILVLRDVNLGTRDILAASVGAVILVVGLSYSLLPRQLAVALLIALTGLSIYTQLNSSYPYTQGWAQQRNLWWQLSWRAPQIAPGTVLVVDAEFAWGDRLREYEVSAPAHFIYAYATRQTRLHSTQLDADDLPYIQAASWRQEMNFANTLVLSLHEGCLRVLDKTRLYELPPGMSDLAAAAAPFSESDLILLNEAPASPPREIFGAAPEQGWCYAFQQADLARQREDWSRVAQLGDEVQAQGLTPQDVSEWLPFLEGYFYAEQPDSASALVQIILAQQPTFDTRLCTLLEALPTQSASLGEWLNTTAAELACFDLYRVWATLIEPDALVFYPSNVYQLPLEAPLPGLVREIDLPEALQPLINEWRSSKAAAPLHAAGIQYILLDQTWWQYADALALAQLAEDYTLVHQWEQPRTGQFYRLYRLNAQ